MNDFIKGILVLSLFAVSMALLVHGANEGNVWTIRLAGVLIGVWHAIMWNRGKR